MPIRQTRITLNSTNKKGQENTAKKKTTNTNTKKKKQTKKTEKRKTHNNKTKSKQKHNRKLNQYNDNTKREINTIMNNNKQEHLYDK